MENKNEDSHGSDSLDKTLQQKCKMDDANQCGSKTLEPVRVADVADSVGDGTNIKEKAQIPGFDQQQNEQVQQQLQNSSTKPLKTETYLMGDGINAVATVARETSLRFFKASSTINNTIFSRDDSDSSSSSSSYGNSSNNNHNSSNNSSKGNGSNNSKIKSSGTHNIEKKVKQISQNLQETSLEVEKVASDEESSPLNAASSTSSYSASIISASTSAMLTHSIAATNLLDNEQPGPLHSDSTSNSESTLSHSEMDTNSLAANDSTEDNSDQRSKKVRFHPDVKENDGGNRIIPKKKKKLKLQTNEELTTLSYKVTENCTDMEFDDNASESEDEEDYDEEEEFDIEKTIADAENYLKQHPIIFVPSMPQQKASTISKVPLPSGLMTEEDLEPSDEEKNKDVDKEVTVQEIDLENGVECILGKRTINGACSYLLRYTEKSALYWEPEDFINKNCPKLLCHYKKQQQQQQKNLMKYVAKRQNLRQRYTDF